MVSMADALHDYQAQLENGGGVLSNGRCGSSRGESVSNLVLYDDVSITSANSLGSEHDLGSIPQKKRRKVFPDGGQLMTITYTVIIIVMGVAFPVREALHSRWLTTYEEALFLVYIYGVSFLFMLFVEIYLVQMDRKHGHEKKQKKNKPQILVKDKNKDTQSIYNTVNGKFETASQVALAKRKQSMVEAGNGVEIFLLEPPDEHDEPHAHHTGLYVRFGVVIFGIGHMVYDGLLLQQIQNNKDNNNACIPTKFVWPHYLNLLFLIFQTYFIFKQQEIHITFVKPLARLGFMHLFATNVCVWIRVVIRETLDTFLHHGSGVTEVADGHGDAVVDGHGDTVVDVHRRAAVDTGHLDDAGHYNVTTPPDYFYNVTDSLGLTSQGGCNTDTDILIKSAPYLFPCVLEYSLLAAAVMFSFYADVGIEERCTEEEGPPDEESEKEIEGKRVSAFTTEINFHKSHKGMFAGIMIIAGTMVSVVLFFSYVSQGMAAATVVYHATNIGLYSIVLIASIIAFIQLHRMKFNRKLTISVDDVMLVVSMGGFVLFQIFKLFPLMNQIRNSEHVRSNDVLTLAEVLLAMVVVIEQTMFLIDGLRRTSRTEEQHHKKPGRGAVMCLLLTNVALWLFRTFHMKEVEVDGNFQELEYGYLAWQLILHALVPLLIFYHFHSSACLAEIWSSAYEAPPSEPKPSKHLQDDNEPEEEPVQGDLAATPSSFIQMRGDRARGSMPILTVSEKVDAEMHSMMKVRVSKASLQEDPKPELKSALKGQRTQSVKWKDLGPPAKDGDNSSVQSLERENLDAPVKDAHNSSVQCSEDENSSAAESVTMTTDTSDKMERVTQHVGKDTEIYGKDPRKDSAVYLNDNSSGNSSRNSSGDSTGNSPMELADIQWHNGDSSVQDNGSLKPYLRLQVVEGEHEATV